MSSLEAGVFLADLLNDNRQAAAEAASYLGASGIWDLLPMQCRTELAERIQRTLHDQFVGEDRDTRFRRAVGLACRTPDCRAELVGFLYNAMDNRDKLAVMVIVLGSLTQAIVESTVTGSAVGYESAHIAEVREKTKDEQLVEHLRRRSAALLAAEVSAGASIAASIVDNATSPGDITDVLNPKSAARCLGHTFMQLLGLCAFLNIDLGLAVATIIGVEQEMAAQATKRALEEAAPPAQEKPPVDTADAC